MILVDLEIYEPNEILPGAFHGFSKLLPVTLNRVTIFRMLGLEDLLERHPERCHCWHNNILVSLHQVAPQHLGDGDYPKILVGDPDSDRCSGDSHYASQDDETEEEHSDDFVSGTQTFQKRHPSARAMYLYLRRE